MDKFIKQNPDMKWLLYNQDICPITQHQHILSTQNYLLSAYSMPGIKGRLSYI